MEPLVLHELRAWSSHTNSRGEISHWRSSSGREVDFVFSRVKFSAGIVVKAATTWRREWGGYN